MSNRLTSMVVRTDGLHPPAPLWIAAGLAVGPMVAIGLARFAYALLLPAMRLDLGWSYAAAGAINTANAAGYLLGAVTAATLATRYGDRAIFVVGVFCTAAALIGSGIATSFSALLLLRFLAGLFGALAFVVGATLASEAGNGSSRDRQSLLISIYFAGAGFGIVLSSLIGSVTLPAGASGWRAAWIGFGAVSIAAGMVAVGAARSTTLIASDQASARGSGATQVSLLPLSAAYTLFGAGYVAYMTFIVAFLRGEGFDATTLSTFWTVLGLASLAACFFWGRIFAGLSAGWPLFIVLVINACGAVAPLLSATKAGAFVSAILFGASLMAAPSAVTVYVRKARPPQAWTAEIGWLTVLFGLGQSIGPILAGYLSDGPAGVRLGLSVSVAVIVVGAAMAAFQQEPASPSSNIT